MTCDSWRTAYSARLDGEDPGESPRMSARHERACAACRSWAQRADELHGSARRAGLAPVPDLASPILVAIRTEPRPRRSRQTDDGREAILRTVLAVLAFAQILYALPALLGDDAGVPIHTAHYLGSLDLAIGVGFLAAAFRPRLVTGLMPVGIALVACLVLTATIDVAAGNVALGDEVQHIVAVAALAVAAILADRRPRAADAPRIPVSASR